MKVIGETKDGLICTLSEDELRVIMFGCPSSNVTPIQKQQWNQKENGEIKICDLYTSYRRFQDLKKSDDYNSAKYALGKMIEALEPVDKFIEIEKSDKSIRIINE
jgi:hypothetical protein